MRLMGKKCSYGKTTDSTIGVLYRETTVYLSYTYNKKYQIGSRIYLNNQQYNEII